MCVVGEDRRRNRDADQLRPSRGADQAGGERVDTQSQDVDLEAVGAPDERATDSPVGVASQVRETILPRLVPLSSAQSHDCIPLCFVVIKY